MEALQCAVKALVILTGCIKTSRLYLAGREGSRPGPEELYFTDKGTAVAISPFFLIGCNMGIFFFLFLWLYFVSLIIMHELLQKGGCTFKKS